MPDDRPPLTVWCFGRRAGLLTQTDGGMEFVYATDWVTDGMPPLSQSLPLDGGFDRAAAAAFFGGLLPEGEPRRQLARLVGVSETNDYSLLAMIAGDTAGALTLLPEGEPPRRVGEDVTWLSEAELADVLADLPARPMHVDEDGEYRLSLAGAQDKLPVVVDADGRIGLTKGQTPSTHIIKTPIERLPNTVVNEAFCPLVGQALGVDVVTATPHRVGDREFLLVERYDRRHEGEAVVRLHQEDFCQALAIPTDRKYQAEGGPSLADCFALIRRATAVPAHEVIRFLDHVALNFLVGNHDAHGKNFSLLYLPESGRATLAPAYDVLSTFAYRNTHNLTRKMAMSVGGEYRPEYVRARHLDRLFDEAGLGAAAARRRLRQMAQNAPRAARGAREQLIAAGWDAPILGQIVELINQRAQSILDIAAPGRGRPANERSLVVPLPRAQSEPASAKTELRRAEA
jgi:serine/threonine-protein kinase HipA